MSQNQDAEIKKLHDEIGRLRAMVTEAVHLSLSIDSETDEGERKALTGAIRLSAELYFKDQGIAKIPNKLTT